MHTTLARSHWTGADLYGAMDLSGNPSRQVRIGGVPVQQVYRTEDRLVLSPLVRRNVRTLCESQLVTVGSFRIQHQDTLGLPVYLGEVPLSRMWVDWQGVSLTPGRSEETTWIADQMAIPVGALEWVVATDPTLVRVGRVSHGDAAIRRISKVGACWVASPKGDGEIQARPLLGQHAGTEATGPLTLGGSPVTQITAQEANIYLTPQGMQSACGRWGLLRRVLRGATPAARLRDLYGRSMVQGVAPTQFHTRKEGTPLTVLEALERLRDQGTDDGAVVFLDEEPIRWAVGDLNQETVWVSTTPPDVCVAAPPPSPPPEGGDAHRVHAWLTRCFEQGQEPRLLIDGSPLGTIVLEETATGEVTLHLRGRE